MKQLPAHTTTTTTTTVTTRGRATASNESALTAALAGNMHLMPVLLLLLHALLARAGNIPFHI
eukprot:NODE_1894_length_872_cov_495.260024_g1318_i0.p4 GENE.NODE_1894_length_872_cov_495.260024_g1318_i0~~NODE_1894_length_872_cov_495.260024_g1318_i0.p4  ORF type:complete len:63 (+),score=1.80 NODE_1894_length_872_cov_495.260024_g1318_i0:183-371(+)